MQIAYISDLHDVNLKSIDFTDDTLTYLLTCSNEDASTMSYC